MAFAVPQWSLTRVVQLLLQSHEVLGDDLAARLQKKLGSLVCQAVLCDIALLFRPEIVRVIETSSDAAGECLTRSSVSVVAESRQCGAGGGHGVYKAGNVKLQPQLLVIFQKFASQEVGHENPLFFSSTTDRLPRSPAWRLLSVLSS